ncbi:type-F conjugative transfer system pilin assembly protein TraF, partial [Vibrio vulnificus]
MKSRSDFKAQRAINPHAESLRLIQLRFMMMKKKLLYVIPLVLLVQV